MNCRIIRKVNTRAQVLSTEIDFGLALVKISCIEWSFGDSARAARALSEARNIHLAMAATIHPTKGCRNLRRKFAELANILKKINQVAPDPSQSSMMAAGLDLDSARLRHPVIEPRAIMTAAS